MKWKQGLLSLVAGALVFGGATACGGGQPVSYAPVAYGQNGLCYYVNSPAEVVALQAQGLCPHSWTPFLMPLLWHQQYYPYYSSPAYYNYYVPVATRTVYVQQQTVFKTQYASQIKTASASAKYKGSNGKVVTGNKVSPAKFGGGSRSGGGGGSRSKTCGMAQSGGDLTLVMKGGGGFGGGGGSRGGSSGGSRGGSSGGSRSSTSGGGSKPRSGSGGC